MRILSKSHLLVLFISLGFSIHSQTTGTILRMKKTILKISEFLKMDVIFDDIAWSTFPISTISLKEFSK